MDVGMATDELSGVLIYPAGYWYTAPLTLLVAGMKWWLTHTLEGLDQTNSRTLQHAMHAGCQMIILQNHGWPCTSSY